MKMRALISITAIALIAPAVATEYRIRVVKDGLASPTGIAVSGAHPFKTIWFTQVPTPGVPGGGNSVDKMFLPTRHVVNIHSGEPDPVNIAISPSGFPYWTCRSAGVILRQTATGVEPILTGLQRPIGISFDAHHNLYFTQVPTPGVAGGKNTVNLYDGSMIHILTMGEPEPTDIAADRYGNAYWTCKSAGVILKRDSNGNVSLLLHGLNKPVGIAVDRTGDNLYFTEVPTPGIPGSMGGGNFVWKYNVNTGQREIVHFGDPEPTDVAVSDDGFVYWTCTIAGVIIEARPIPRRH